MNRLNFVYFFLFLFFDKNIMMVSNNEGGGNCFDLVYFVPQNSLLATLRLVFTSHIININSIQHKPECAVFVPSLTGVREEESFFKRLFFILCGFAKLNFNDNNIHGWESVQKHFPGVPHSKIDFKSVYINWASRIGFAFACYLLYMFSYMIWYKIFAWKDFKWEFIPRHCAAAICGCILYSLILRLLFNSKFFYSEVLYQKNFQERLVCNPNRVNSHLVEEIIYNDFCRYFVSKYNKICSIFDTLSFFVKREEKNEINLKMNDFMSRVKKSVERYKKFKDHNEDGDEKKYLLTKEEEHKKYSNEMNEIIKPLESCIKEGTALQLDLLAKLKPKLTEEESLIMFKIMELDRIRYYEKLNEKDLVEYVEKELNEDVIGAMSKVVKIFEEGKNNDQFLKPWILFLSQYVHYYFDAIIKSCIKKLFYDNKEGIAYFLDLSNIKEIDNLLDHCNHVNPKIRNLAECLSRRIDSLMLEKNRILEDATIYEEVVKIETIKEFLQKCKTARDEFYKLVKEYKDIILEKCAFLFPPNVEEFFKKYENIHDDVWKYF